MISRTLSGAGSIVRRWNWRGRSISNPASLNALVNELLKKHIELIENDSSRETIKDSRLAFGE